MTKAPTNFKSNNVGADSSFGNGSTKSIDKSVMNYPKNGLEAVDESNKSKGSMDKKAKGSNTPNTIGGTPYGN